MSDAAAPSPSSSPASRPLWQRLVLGLAGAVLALGLIGAIGAIVGLAVASRNLPELAAITDYQPKLPLRVYSAEGDLLGEFGDERRQFMPIDQIPKVMQEAVLAIEDARFYEHSGVDYWGVLRAGLAQFGNVGSQGASTITMQVARNFYLSSEKTLTRKLYEVLLALRIEHALTKKEILELYMNQIFLGQRAHGFAAASEIYFGKPLKDVTIAEAAMLAGLPKAPSAYNPIANPRRATIRQQYIIDRMLDHGFITRAEHEAAKVEQLVYRRQTLLPYHGEYAAEMARQMIYSQYGDETYTRGLQVQLTVHSKEQLAGYRALRKGLMDFERRQVYRGPEATADLPSDPALVDARIAEVLADHPDNDELKAAVVLEASPRKVVAALQSGEQFSVQGDGLRPVTSGLAANAAPGRQIRRGSVVRAMRVGKDWTLTQLPEVEGALIAMDPDTGAISAMVGGFDFGKNKFNHATQAWRQPGSAFKPFIYSAALEKGFGPATVVNDGPLFFDAGATGSQPWEPKNYDGKFEGPMPLRRALAKSKNMVSIRILQSIGVGYARDWVTRFGFDRDKHPPYLPMALGAGSVTPMQMAVGYGAFANGGYRVSPVLIARVTDTHGKVLHETHLATPTEAQRVIDARNAFVMDSLLQEVARSGTAARAQATLKRPDLYGKTGTTNDSMDAWFAGFGPTRVAVVWIGYDTPRKLGDRETGGGLSLPVWIDYMGTVLASVPVAEKTAPPGVVQLGDWYYEEYAHGGGVQSIVEQTAEPGSVPPPPTDEEKKSILDLFR